MKLQEGINMPANKVEAIGPFKAIGLVLSSVGIGAQVLNTTLTSAENSVARTASLVDKSFNFADYAMDDAMEDFATDRVVEDAKRRVRRAEAEAEAAAIIAAIPKPTPAK